MTEGMTTDITTGKTTFEELLARDGRLVYRTRGTSMRPMLTQNRDLVVIEPVKEPLKRYDVVLYRRGEKYILHRVLRVKGPNCIIRGDNTYANENVPMSTIIGVLTRFKRNKKEYGAADSLYRLYVRVWTAIYPLRWLKMQFRRCLVALLKKTGLIGPLKRLLGRK